MRSILGMCVGLENWYLKPLLKPYACNKTMQKPGCVTFRGVMGAAGDRRTARNGGCEGGVSKGAGRVGGWIPRQGGNPGSSSAEGSQS